MRAALILLGLLLAACQSRTIQTQPHVPGSVVRIDYINSFFFGVICALEAGEIQYGKCNDYKGVDLVPFMPEQVQIDGQVQVAQSNDGYVVTLKWAHKASKKVTEDAVSDWWIYYDESGRATPAVASFSAFIPGLRNWNIPPREKEEWTSEKLQGGRLHHFYFVGQNYAPTNDNRYLFGGILHAKVIIDLTNVSVH